METSLRQIREFGEAVIAIDQEPSKLSNSIKANTSTKITFTLGNDIHDMARSLGLSDEERQYLHLLSVGQAIVTEAGRLTTPVHVLFLKVIVRKGGITDEDLKTSPSTQTS